MLENDKNDILTKDIASNYLQERKESSIQVHLAKLSTDSFKEKIYSNPNNSDSFQIFNSYQEEDFNKNNNNIDDQAKNNIFNNNIDKDNKFEEFNHNMIKEEEDDLEKFYEQQQMKMEKALKKNSINNFKSHSKDKSKLDQNRTSKNSFRYSDNNTNKNSLISSNYNNNFNTTVSNTTKNNLKNLKNSNNNPDYQFKNSKEIKVEGKKNHKIDLINEKHLRNKSTVIKTNVIDNDDIIKTSFINNSSQSKNERNLLKTRGNINRSYSKKDLNPSIDNFKKINKLNNSNIIENTKKPKINISSSKVNNSAIINNNKISYENYNSGLTSKIETPKNILNKNLKKSDSITNFKSARKISSEKNRSESANKENMLKISGYKDYTNNGNNIHNIVKLKISNTKVEELTSSIQNSHSKDKKNNTNNASILDRKKKLEKNNYSKINISTNNYNNINNYSGLMVKPDNFLTIQDPGNNLNKLDAVNSFRKNTVNLKINTNNNTNLSGNLIENLFSNRNKDNSNKAISPGINSLKSDKIPIKISSVDNTVIGNDKSKISNFDINNKDKNKKNDFNTDLAKYLDKEKENNSYTYLINKKKNAEKDQKTLKNAYPNKDIKNLETSKKLNNSVDAVTSNMKYKKLNTSLNKSDKIINVQNKEQVLIEKILKENNISLSKAIDSDDKRCFTSNEKLNEFFTMNLNFESILNNDKNNKNNNNLNLNQENDFSDIALSDLKNEENPLLDNINNNEIKIKNDEDNYLINSNISNNLKISNNSYIRNLNHNRTNENKEFMKDNSIANLLFANENNKKDNLQLNNMINNNMENNNLIKNRLEKVNTLSRSNQYNCNMIKNANANLNNNVINYNNIVEDTKQSNSDKISQYTEIYNKRKETLEKLNKSNIDKDKDFYEKNMEWRKRLNQRASFIRDQVEKERYKECHFTPKGIKRNVSKEALENFYEKNMIWKQNVEKYKQTQNLIKERKEYEECYFQPTTNKKVYESNIGLNKDFVKPDEFYKKNMEWLEKTRINKKKAELQYQEEIKSANLGKTKIRERISKYKKRNNNFFKDNNENMDNSININSEFEYTPKSVHKNLYKIKNFDRSLTPRERNINNRSFVNEHHLRKNKLCDKNHSRIGIEPEKIEEDSDIQLENELKEMEFLMQSLNKIVDENDHVMSIPDNQEEFLLLDNFDNNQKFTNNDPNKVLNFKINYDKIYSSRILNEQERESNYKMDFDSLTNMNEKYKILTDKIKKNKFIKIVEEKFC